VFADRKFVGSTAFAYEHISSLFAKLATRVYQEHVLKMLISHFA
jgi:hypothetical protein